MVLEKISEVLEFHDESAKSTTSELNTTMNERDFSSLFNDGDHFESCADHEAIHTGYKPDINVYKRESEHR